MNKCRVKYCVFFGLIAIVVFLLFCDTDTVHQVVSSCPMSVHAGVTMKGEDGRWKTKGCFPGAGVFTQKDIPVTVLASYPGSGNTWTRHLLTTATGILTGTVYDLPFGVYVGHGFNTGKAKRVIVVKTHSSTLAAERQFHPARAIVIIRNPYETYLAEFNRQGGATRSDIGQLFVRGPQDFVREWPTFLSRYLLTWKAMYIDWAKFEKPLHVLVYHRLVENLERELKLAINFLNESAILPHLHCALDAPEGRHHRKKPVWLTQAANYNARFIKTLNRHIDEVQEAFERRLKVDFSDFQRWKR